MAKTRKQYAKEYAERNPDKILSYRLKRKFGLSLDEYKLILDAQKGLCAICGKPAIGRGQDKNLAVDHSHKNNEIRGLLCFKCNTGLGNFNDSVKDLKKAIKYLESWQ